LLQERHGKQHHATIRSDLAAVEIGRDFLASFLIAATPTT
jgi:hypothetical protein